MNAPAKYLFDTDFAASANKEQPLSRAEIAERIAEAESKSYRQGFDAAQREASVEVNRRSAAAKEKSAAAMEHIGRAMQVLLSSIGNVESRMETEAVDVAVAVARKLCSQLLANEPLAEMAALVTDCFQHLTSTPHIVIRVNDALYEEAREQVEALARRNGFEGRLVILAEPDVAVADCKIEWADGGYTLDRAAAEAKIDELVSRYIAARNQAGSAGRGDAT